MLVRQCTACLTVLFLVLSANGQHILSGGVDNRCSTPNMKPGECIPIKECNTLINTLILKKVDDTAKKYLNKAVCSYDRNNHPIVCCERDAGACLTPDDNIGACVPLGRCNTLLDYINKKPFLSDKKLTYLRQAECEYGTENTARICCPIFHRTINDNVSVTQRVGKPVDLPTPGEEAGYCGVSETEERIIGGNVTGLFEFPWMALIQYNDPERTFGCGGSLIHERFVLTAAHCVKGPKVEKLNNVRGVRLGEWDTTLSEDCANNICTDNPVDILAEQIISHPGFALDVLTHDIALIKLKQSSGFSEFIRPVCLPVTRTPIPNELTVVGWGRTEIAVQSNVKLKLSIPYYKDKAKCEENLNKNSQNKRTLGAGQFCAGGKEAQDSCTGDSGGPLLTTQAVSGLAQVFYQLGIVSFGYWPCGIEGRAGVYTKVDEYIPWIKENMRL